MTGKGSEMTAMAPTVVATEPQCEAFTSRARDEALTSCYRASILIAVLLAIAAGAGLLLDVYRDNEWVSSQLRGQDFVSLVFGLPLLLTSAYLASKGSVRGLLAWLGVLGYIGYSYLYVFGIAWNGLFLVYVALLFTSAYTLIRALIALDPLAISSSFEERAPTKAVARFFAFFGVVLGALWGVQAVGATLSGGVPASVTSSGHPTAVVFVLDLGLVVPSFIIGARLLRRGAPWGFVLAGILLVKGITEGLALLGMALFTFLADHPDFDVALIPLWAFVAITSTHFAIRFYGAIRSVTNKQLTRRS